MKILCLVETDDRNYYFQSACMRLEREYPGQIEARCFSTSAIRMQEEVYEEFSRMADACDFAVLYFHGGCANLPDFQKFWKKITSHAPCFFVSTMPEEMAECLPECGLTTEQYRKLNAYFSRPSKENTYRMMLSIANLGGIGVMAEACQDLAMAGIYCDGKVLEEKKEEAYQKRIAEDGRMVIGVMLHRNAVQSGNTKAIDALLEEISRQGAIPLAVFSSISPENEEKESGAGFALEKYFQYRGKKIVDAILVATAFGMTASAYPQGSLKPFRSSMFEIWNVPIIHAAATRLNRRQYEERIQGIDAMSLNSHVFQPEMDGQVISVPYAVNEEISVGELKRKMWEPLQERIRHLVRLCINFARLSKKQNKEKKIAILFHNVPGSQNIGCGAGLDTFATVRSLLCRMQKEGYCIDTVYKDPQDLANTMLRALTNDLDWISPEEAKKRSVDLVSCEQMKLWHQNLSSQRKENLEAFWGTFPGEVMMEENQLLIPGIANGNIFIGLQPSRAFQDQAQRLYHDAVFPPPYSYIGYYRWIEESFGADAVIHVGTHGTVEWLPGKEVGLSKDCYPDLCLGCLPNFYIYHMGIIGEGTQAKRRSAAVMLDHLPPSMDDAGVYEKLQDMDDAMKEYFMAHRTKSAQLPLLQQRIWQIAEEANLAAEVKLTKESYDADPDAGIEMLHVWMEELKHSVVTDGLHIFGQAPESEMLYENMMRMLVRVKNGDIHGLTDAVLEAQGHDAEWIKAHPASLVGEMSASQIREEALQESKRLIHKLALQQYDVCRISDILQEDAHLWKADTIELYKTLQFLCEDVRVRLDHTTDEMDNLIDGLEGGFVEPGYGGNPTRGNVHLLPSGRNFHAADPDEIPSRGAWQIGQKLADRALEHYLQETGEYPESIAMVIWSGNVIKSSGEDFGEIFSLMGVRPIYLGNTSRVIGVEAIPLEELGRPRVDVTIRISGLFRDMYPNLIERMDEAIACVAALEESDEQNFIKKHVQQDMLQLLEEGLDENSARDQASLRVYGCPAGGYGAGVSNVIATKNWKDYKDLAAIYETWSGNGYGRGYHGESMQGMFKKRLSTVGMTIKNETTVEVDMFSSDDFYSYHGGLAACVKANAGKAPIVLTGHSDDPEHPYVRDAARESARIVRTRMLNPKWLEGLKRHGYRGAQEISKTMDAFFGWDASADIAQDWMYEQIAKNYVLDAKTRGWMEQVNPASVYHMAELLLEAAKRGMWQAQEQMEKQLQHILLQTEGLLEEGSYD